MKAIDIMTRQIATVSPDHSIKHAVEIMIDKKISGLPVVNDDGRLVGILTEGDLLRRGELGAEFLGASFPEQQPAQDYLKHHSWKVGDVMTREIITANEETSIGKIATTMAERGFKRLPVIRGDALVGIVSRADLLNAIVRAKLEAPVKGEDAIRRSVLARFDEVQELKEAQLSLFCTDGEVHLEGIVASAAARDAARAIVEGVGAFCVLDHVKIAPEQKVSNDRSG